jgi:ferredoxin-NADP reductase
MTVTSPEKAQQPWSGETGRIDAEKIKAHVEDVPGAIFYTCGPPPMVEAMQGLLKGIGIGDDRVKIERFTGY